MKHMMKLASFVAIVAAFVGAAAYADDPNLQERLSLQRAQDHGAGLRPTIAVYSHRKGISHAKNEAHPKLRFETRYNTQGEAFGVYVPAE